jgi:type IV pilus assembly protein PilF
MRYRQRLEAPLMTAALIAACASPGQFEHTPDDKKAARINVQLGAAYLERGDLQTASVKLERALREDYSLATAHWTYALLQLRLGRPKLAEKHFRAAIALNPADSRAHNNYGTFLCDASRLAEAQAQFTRALKNPHFDQPETALTNAGICALRAPDNNKAEAYFHKSLDKNPEFAPAVYEMARLSYEQKRYTQTQAYLNRYKRIGGDTAGTLWLAWQIETQLGNRNAADNYAAQLKQRYPESPETARLLQMEHNGS